MGKHLVRIFQLRQEQELEALPRAERRALERTKAEAEAAGATLGHEGVGGVPASLALGIFRRDGWTCKRCGSKADIELHHAGGIENSRDARKGKVNIMSNLVVVCPRCHDAVHDQDRAGGPANQKYKPDPRVKGG